MEFTSLPFAYPIIAGNPNNFWRFFHASYHMQDRNVNTSRQEIIKMKRLVTQPYPYHERCGKKRKKDEIKHMIDFFF